MKFVSTRLVFAGLSVLLFSVDSFAQFTNCVNGRDPVTGRRCVSTIQTAVPFLGIAPDGRGTAMGDAGIALSPTAASTFYNGSMLGFAEDKFAIQATYTPWLQALNLNDVYLLNLNLYGKLDENQAVYGDIRYFSLGEIPFVTETGEPISTNRPNEFAVSAGYARRLTEKFSAGIAGRFILSSLATGLQVPGTGDLIENGIAGAADFSFSYVDNISVGQRSIFRAGMNVRNIGSKITYTNSAARDFLPANLGLGTSLQTWLDDYNSITFSLDFNKLLVPSPGDTTDNDGTGRPDYLDQAPIEGAFASFGDAQGGFNEELREINLSIGAEYWYAEQFAVRVGYFNEPPSKGGRRYVTAGVGLRYNVLGLDFSYLIPASQQPSPLDRTLRVGLTYRFQPAEEEAIGMLYQVKQLAFSFHKRRC